MSEFYLCDTEILGLSHSAVKIYSFLRMVNNSITHESFYKRSNIAAFCHVSKSTVVRSVRELRGKGLLKTFVRFLPDGQQTSNSYILIDNPQLRFDAEKTRPGRVSSPCANKPADTKTRHNAAAAPIRQFRCDPAALRTNLPPSALKVYSYLSFRAGINGKTMPAKKEIAAGCGVSVSSVSRAIGSLSAAGLVEVRRQTRMETCGNNGNSVNLYVMLRPNHKWKMSRVLRNVLFPYPPVSSPAKCFLPFSDILPHVTGDTARTISRMKKKQRKEQYPINLSLRINYAGEEGDYSNSFFPCLQHIKQGAKKMNSIIGLPVIVSARYRIVINSNFRRALSIPETGRVRLLAGRSSLQIFPGSAFAPDAQEKSISAGRFNLPMDWVKRNGIHVGDRVFLIAASDCILVRPSVSPSISGRKEAMS